MLSLYNLHLDGHVGDSLLPLLVIVGEIISQQNPRSSGSYKLSASCSSMFPEPQVSESFIVISFGTRLLNFAYLLQREDFLVRGEDYTSLWGKKTDVYGL